MLRFWLAEQVMEERYPSRKGVIFCAFSLVADHHKRSRGAVVLAPVGSQLNYLAIDLV
jgi:hypothetical protein